MHSNPQGKHSRRIWRFVTQDIWDMEVKSLSRLKRFGINLVKILHLIWKGFKEDECPLHASALTYQSLVAIVPLLALALAVLRGLGAGEIVEGKILQSIAAMPEQFQQFVTNILETVHRVNYTTLGGIGLLFLLVIVIQMMGRVESSFNRVWGVRTSRKLMRKVSDYLSILLVVPVLVVAATTVNATLTSTGIAGFIESHLGAQFLYSRVLSLMPLLITWAAFIFLYKYLPNTNVRAVPAVASGVLGGSVWIGWQWLYISLQIGVSRCNAIYATFASLLIFLYWLYISWQIVLLGAEVGFAFQNYSTYKMEQQADTASAQSKIMLALSIVSCAGHSMIANAPQFEISSYASEHKVPVRLVSEVVNELVHANLLAEVAEKTGCYVLVKIPDQIQIRDVMKAILDSGSSPDSLGLSKLDPAIQQVIDKATAGTAEALQDYTIKELLQFHSQTPSFTRQ